MHRLVILLASGLVIVGVAGCEDRPSWARERLSTSYFDSTETYRSAGVSTRVRADLTPLKPSSLRGDTLGRSFHLLRTRCAACHQVPDPTMKTAQHWPYLVSRMRKRTESAGLIPMTGAEGDTILRLLQKHAKP